MNSHLKCICAILSMTATIALVAIATFRVAPASAQTIVKQHAKCPTSAATSPCYYCSAGQASPSGDGCSNGAPTAGWTIAMCAGHANPSSTCTEMYRMCGTYRMCVSPYTTWGPCNLDFHECK